MKEKSGYVRLVCVADETAPDWAFLTNHARVLVCIAHDPGIRMRDIGERLGITERAAHRIVSALTTAGYITRRRNGRRNLYTINAHLPLPDAIAREQSIGELLAILTGASASKRSVDHTVTAV
jgi:DNA-binding transcriptional ArsR family regulator